MAEEPAPPPVLPAAVRDRVVALASASLSGLQAAQVPPGLRPFLRFTPSRRARLAAVPLAAALETEPAFRVAVAEAVAVALPDVAAAVRTGGPLPAAPAEDLAAAAYLLRPPGWTSYVQRVVDELPPTDAAVGEQVQRLTEQLAALRASSRAEIARLRAELERARADAVSDVRVAREEVAGLRRKVRELGDRAGRAEAALRAAEDAEGPAPADAAAGGPGTSGTEGAELRRLRERLAAAEQLVEQLAERAAGHRGRERRSAEELRLRLLLDTLLGAATGLRRELALPPLQERPADAVVADYVREPPPTAARGLDADDPALLDALLAVPLTHLLVDGYNVTKSGYGELPLEAQRGRLLSGLGVLAARTGAEVTVVFDGAERVASGGTTAPRGVRLLFSRAEETADEVLVRLVGLEPRGRPLVVVTSDREVVTGVQRQGARAVPSTALLRLLGR